MNRLIQIVANISLIVTSSSSLILAMNLLGPQFTHAQITGEFDSDVWFVIAFMVLLFLQCLATLFSQRFTFEKKVYRSLVLTLAFAIPWFFIY